MYPLILKDILMPLLPSTKSPTTTSEILELWKLPQSLPYNLVLGSSPEFKSVQYILGMPIKGDTVVIPYWNPFTNSPMTFSRDSEEFELIRVRLMNPTEDCKYLSPLGCATRLYFSTLITSEQWIEAAKNRNIPIVLVEGEKKADYLARFFPLILPIGIPGIWQWAASKHESYVLKLLKMLQSRGYRFVDNVDIYQPEILKAFLVVVKFIYRAKKEEGFGYNLEELKPYVMSYTEYLANPTANCQLPSMERMVDLMLDDFQKQLERGTRKQAEKLLRECIKELPTSDTAEKALHRDLLHNCKLTSRDVLICFDSEVDRTSPRYCDSHSVNHFLNSAKQLCHAITQVGAKPCLMQLPKPPIGLSRYGVDDLGHLLGDEAIKDLIVASITHKAELGLVINPDRPRSKYSEENESSKIINPAICSKELSAKILAVILKYREKIVYRQSIGWYKFTGTHWVKIQGDTEVQSLIIKASENQSELQQGLSPKFLSSYVIVEESKFNYGESQGLVLLSNGVFDMVNHRFTPLDEIANIQEYYFTGKLQANYTIPSEESLTNLKIFLKQYISTKSEFKYLLAMAYWLMFPKHFFTAQNKKFPVEKMFYLVGSQGTGKSTFLEFLMRVIMSPENIVSISPDKLNSVEGVGNYMTASLWKSNDFSGKVSKDTIETLNKVISGEAIEGRLLYKQSITKVIPASIILAGNDTLSFPQSGTQGILRRLVYIPFNKPITNYDRAVVDYTASQEAIDTFFYAITQITLQDCVEVLNSALYIPKSFEDKTIQAQDANDYLSEFFFTVVLPFVGSEPQINESVVGFKNKPLIRTDLFSMYRTYCDDNGIANQFTARNLEKALLAKDYLKIFHADENGNPTRYSKYKGNLKLDVNWDAISSLSEDNLRLFSTGGKTRAMGVDNFISKFFGK